MGAPTSRDRAATLVGRSKLRLQLLGAIAAEPESCPSELHKRSQFGDVELGTISYHVRALSKAGLLTLVRTSVVRGAVRHHYSVTESGRQAVRDVAREYAIALDRVEHGQPD